MLYKIVKAVENLVEYHGNSNCIEYNNNSNIISLYDYIERIDKYTYCRCDETLICALVLLDRLPSITKYTMHINFYLAYFFADIYLSDYKIDINRCFDISGITKKEFKYCSRVFLNSIKYNISISQEEYENKKIMLSRI